MYLWTKVRHGVICSAMGLALGFQVPATLSAQEAPSSDRFLPTLDYLLTVADTADPEAEFYLSERGDSYLIFSESLPGPVVLRLGNRAVLVVPKEGLSTGDDGMIDLLPSAETQARGEFGIDGSTPTFDIDGKTVKIAYPEPLLGDQKLAALQDYNPEYQRRAAAYEPDAALMDTLGQAVGEAPLRVKIYFGTWCSICSRAMPNLMKVVESLPTGAQVEMEYYGLPQKRGGDPVVETLQLQGVPTAIVYRGDKEIGRLQRDQFRKPEESLGALLTGIGDS